MKYAVFGLVWFIGSLVCALALGKLMGRSSNNDGQFVDESKPFTVRSSSDDELDAPIFNS